MCFFLLLWGFCFIARVLLLLCAVQPVGILATIALQWVSYVTTLWFCLMWCGGVKNSHQSQLIVRLILTEVYVSYAILCSHSTW